MSFQTELYTLISTNAAIQAAGVGVYYQNLPDNFSPTVNCIVYATNAIESVDVIGQNGIMKIYELRLMVFSQNTKTIDDINETINAQFDNYQGGKFRDFHFEGSNLDEEFEREQYVSTLTYRVIYQP